MSESTGPVVKDLLDVKQEPADECDNVYDRGDPNYCVKQELPDEYETEAPYVTMQVSCECRYLTTFDHSRHRLTVHLNSAVRMVFFHFESNQIE